MAEEDKITKLDEIVFENHISLIVQRWNGYKRSTCKKQRRCICCHKMFSSRSPAHKRCPQCCG